MIQDTFKVGLCLLQRTKLPPDDVLQHVREYWKTSAEECTEAITEVNIKHNYGCVGLVLKHYQF